MIFLSDDVFRLQKSFILLLPVVLALEKQEKEEDDDDDDTKADLVVVVVVVLVALTAAVVRSAANLCIVLSRAQSDAIEVCFLLFFFFLTRPADPRTRCLLFCGKKKGRTRRRKTTSTEIGPCTKKSISSQQEGKTEITMFATTTSTKTNSFSSRLSSSLRKPRSSAKKSINATVRVLYVSSPKPKICQIANLPFDEGKTRSNFYGIRVFNMNTHTQNKQSNLFSLSLFVAARARASLTSNFRCHVFAFYFDETNLCLDFISKTRINYYYCFV